MELIDRYVHEVGRQLPEKIRADIEREIHSLLEDGLEARAAEAGKPADEQMAVGLLKEFGDPQNVAASYHHPRYLVGPALYPTWESIVKVVLTVLAVVAVVEFAFSIVRPGLGPANMAEMGQALARSTGDLINSIFISLGIITVIFALNERFLTNLKTASKDWDPRKLKAVVVESNRVNVVGTAFEVALNLVAIVVLNFYLDRIGIYSYNDGAWILIPIFSSVFWMYLPAITVLTGLKAGLGIWLIEARGWNTWSRLTDIGLRLATLVLLVAMVSGPSIFAPSAQLLRAWSQAGLDQAGAASLQSGMEIGMRVVLGLALIGETIEIGKRIYATILNRH